MIDERFSAEAFISSGIDTDESQKLADLLEKEVASELHQIINAKLVEIVDKLNSIGHSLKREDSSKVGDISYRDDFWTDERIYQCKLRLAVDTVISTGYSHLIDLD